MLHQVLFSIVLSVGAIVLPVSAVTVQSGTDFEYSSNNFSPVAQDLSFITSGDTRTPTSDIKPATLAKKIKRAQLKFYKAFNEVNDLDEYDIICKRRGSLSNSSKYKVCEPAYSRKLRLHLENTNNARSSSNFERFRELTAENNKNALAQLTHIIGKYPELHQQFSEIRTMTRQYQNATGHYMAAFCPGVDPADYIPGND